MPGSKDTKIPTVTKDNTPLGVVVPVVTQVVAKTKTKLVGSLDDLEDVELANPINDDVLTYENGTWINKPIPESPAWDFDEGDSSTVYDVGTLDLDEGGS